MGFWTRFRRHRIIDQTVGEGGTAVLLCNCGGWIEISEPKRVPIYAEYTPIPISYRLEGITVESTCRKFKAQPLPKAIVR